MGRAFFDAHSIFARKFSKYSLAGEWGSTWRAMRYPLIIPVSECVVESVREGELAL